MTLIYIYWISTALLCTLYLASAGSYIAKREWAAKAIAELGYPRYLVALLAAAKILAVVAILTRWNAGLADLAYAGVLYHLLLSGAAHLGVRKPKAAIPAAVGLVLLVASFATQNIARDKVSLYAPMAQNSAPVIQRSML